MTSLVSWLYLAAAVAGASFALVELRLLVRFWRHRAVIRRITRRAGRAGDDAPPVADVPSVTVQIPLYNERTAAERVILAAATQDYPRERFEIQVLDDSTDETPAIVARVVGAVRRTGVRIEHIRRRERRGYKAGALAEGLARSRSDLVALFDADFRPDDGFLRSLILEDRVFDDDDVAFVQARWAFEDPRAGVLAAAQSLLLDRHFYIQKPTREFTGGVTTFNGSGGIWRRAAIEAAGGWSADTLTEDLDLSFRCALHGWRGRYVHHVAVPSELPGHMRAFKLQQRRWARGNAQCARKLTGRVLRSSGVLRDRWDEAFLLAGYFIHPVLLANVVLWPWAVLAMDRRVFLVLQGFMGLALLAAPLSMAMTLRERGQRLSVGALGDLLAGLCLGIGLMVNNTAGQLLGYLTREGEFARTPKAGRSVGDPALRALGAEKSYRNALHWTFFAELVLVAYCVAGAVMLMTRGEALWSIPLLFWGLCVGLVVQMQVARQPASG